MAYKHGVYVSEQATAIVPPQQIDVSTPVVFGTAPVAMLAAGLERPVNKPVLIYSYAEFVTTFGYDEDWTKYTLCEFAYSYFALYAVAPVIFVNVLDPDVHKTPAPEADMTFDADGLIALGKYGVTALSLKSADGLTTFVAGTDYALDASTGRITRKTGGTIAAGATVKVAYTYVDPTKVDSDDIIGGVEVATGRKTGLELVGDVFPRFRLVPGQVVAPGWSHDPAVAMVMAAKCSSINGHFKAIAVVDLPETVARYSDAPGYKNDHNLVDPLMVVCWPRLKMGEKTFWMSSQLAALMAKTDAANDSVPYKSPSNESFKAESTVVNGQEVWLGLDEAAYLNGQGIVTALNFIGGWRCWGNRTGCYPSTTDVKDAFIPIRRMFNWIGNQLVLNAWQKVDNPIRRRLIQTVLDSFQIWLNGLTAREYILGGRVEFQDIENPVTDLMDGIVRFHVYVTPPSPAREISFTVEYDPAYVETLFS